MVSFLRIIGILNAAVWLGAAAFYLLVVGSAFSSSEMRNILPLSHSGAAALIVQAHYFALLHWCGAIALAHLIVEYLYVGRSMRHWLLYLVIGLFGLGLIGGLTIHPRLKHLHLEIYGIRSTAQQRQQAAKSFQVWNALSQTINIFTLLGLSIFAYQICIPANPSRFVSANKFRG